MNSSAERTPANDVVADSNESLLRLMADVSTSLMAYYTVLALECRFANQLFVQFYGWDTRAILGKSLCDIVGRHVMDFISDDTRHVVIEQVRAKDEEPYEAVVVRKDGMRVPVELVGKSISVGTDTHRLTVVRNIRARKEAQARIEFMALHDALTHLPNRAFLVERQHPVADVAVVGVPSDRWGETPVAFVVAHDAASETAAELLQWANARLGRTQRLADLQLRAEMPRGPIGKVLKGALRAAYDPTSTNETPSP